MPCSFIFLSMYFIAILNTINLLISFYSLIIYYYASLFYLKIIFLSMG